MYRRFLVFAFLIMAVSFRPGLHAEESAECGGLLSSARTLMNRLNEQRDHLDRVRDLKAQIEKEYREAFDRMSVRSVPTQADTDTLATLTRDLYATISEEARVSQQMLATLTALQAVSGLLDTFCGEADDSPPPVSSRPNPKLTDTSGKEKIPAPRGPMSRELLPAPMINGTWGNDFGGVFQVNGGSFTADGVVRLRVSVTGPGKTEQGVEGYTVQGHQYNKRGEPEANYRGVLYKRSSTGLWVIGGAYQWLNDTRWYGCNYYEWAEEK